MHKRLLLNIPDHVDGWRLVARGKSCHEPLGQTGRGHQRWWIDASQSETVAIYQKGDYRVSFSLVLGDGRPYLEVNRLEEIIPGEWETLDSTNLPIERVQQNYIEIALSDMG